MRIAIEATQAQKEATGFGYYVIRLLQAFSELETGHEFLLFHATRDWKGENFGRNFAPISYWNPTGKQSAAIFFSLNSKLLREKADLFHATCSTGLPWKLDIPGIATVHDLYPLHHASHSALLQACFFRLLWAPVKRNAAHILCNSEFTMHELERLEGIPREKMTVTSLGPGMGSSCRASDFAHGKKGEKIFLCVGGIEYRKNQLMLARAYQKARKYDSSLPPLVFLGPPRTEGEELEDIIRSSSGSAPAAIRYLHYVPEQELLEYYERAELLCVPSRYEGFGLPLLEAMERKLPVLASDIPVFHEVGGEYPYYIDPEDQNAWTEAFLKFHRRDLTDCFSEAIRQERLAAHSWKRCAELTLGVYEKVASGRR